MASSTYHCSDNYYLLKILLECLLWNWTDMYASVTVFKVFVYLAFFQSLSHDHHWWFCSEEYIFMQCYLPVFHHLSHSRSCTLDYSYLYSAVHISITDYKASHLSHNLARKWATILSMWSMCILLVIVYSHAFQTCIRSNEVHSALEHQLNIRGTSYYC